jgi:hypothetical protein
MAAHNAGGACAAWRKRENNGESGNRGEINGGGGSRGVWRQRKQAAAALAASRRGGIETVAAALASISRLCCTLCTLRRTLACCTSGNALLGWKAWRRENNRWQNKNQRRRMA